MVFEHEDIAVNFPNNLDIAGEVYNCFGLSEKTGAKAS